MTVVHARGNVPASIKRFWVEPESPSFDQSFYFKVQLSDPENKELKCRIRATDGSYDSRDLQTCNDGWSPGHKATWSNGSREYVLEVWDGVHTSTARVTVTVGGNSSGGLRIEQFDVSPSQNVTAWQDITLRWQLRDAGNAKCQIYMYYPHSGPEYTLENCSENGEWHHHYSPEMVAKGQVTVRFVVTKKDTGVSASVERTLTFAGSNPPPPPPPPSSRSPAVLGFSATPVELILPANNPLSVTVTFNYSVSGPSGDVLTCVLETGISSVSVPCDGRSSREFRFTYPKFSGSIKTRLLVRGSQGAEAASDSIGLTLRQDGFARSSELESLAECFGLLVTELLPFGVLFELYEGKWDWRDAAEVAFIVVELADKLYIDRQLSLFPSKLERVIPTCVDA